MWKIPTGEQINFYLPPCTRCFAWSPPTVAAQGEHLLTAPKAKRKQMSYTEFFPTSFYSQHTQGWEVQSVIVRSWSLWYSFGGRTQTLWNLNTWLGSKTLPVLIKFTRLGARWLPDVEQKAKQAFKGHWLGQIWRDLGFASTHFYKSQDIPFCWLFFFFNIRLKQIKVNNSS